MKNNFFIVAGAILILAACSTPQPTTVSTLKLLGIQTTITADITAELDVSPTKVTAYMNMKELKGYSLDLAKEAVISKAVIAANADVLVEPRFIIDGNIYKITGITVTGYPASYKNFKPKKTETK